MKWCAIFFFSLCLFFARPSSAQQCSTTDYNGIQYMKSCSLESKVETLKLYEDQILIGTTNALLSYGLNLDLNANVNLTSDQERQNICMMENNPPGSCNNFIKVIEAVPNSDKVLVCGTNSYFPKCTLHQKNQLTQFSARSASDGYSPYANTFIVSLMSSNQRLFSATTFKFGSVQTTIGMSLNPLNSSDFTVRVSASTNNKKLNGLVRYISAHEHGDYVYFFIAEPALEQTNNPYYARAIRVCKTDNGINRDNPDLNRFLTFQKARMVCRNSVAECGTSGGTTDSDASYFYDNLQSTFMGSEGGAPVLYATFNSPDIGPKGGAICKFSFSPQKSGSLTNVFEDGVYNVGESVNGELVWSRTPNVPSFTCNNINRTQDDANKYDLVYNPVTSTPCSKKPLFTKDGEHLDKIAAETVTYNQDVQEVIYYSNLLGQVKQVVLSSANRGRSFIHNIIAETDTNGNGQVEEVQNLILQKEAGDGRSLYVSRGNKIMQISKGHCERYVDCQSCLRSRDPYCGWKSETLSCVNKFTMSSFIVTQSFSASETDIEGICMITIPPTGTTDSSHGDSSSSDSEATTTNSGSTLIQPSAGGLLPASNSTTSSKVPTIIIAGASTGSFAAGLILGLGVCFIFLCKKNKRNSDKVQDDYTVTDKSTKKADVEMALEAAKKDELNNNTKELDKNPAPTEINEALKPIPPPRYVEHAPPPLQQPQPPFKISPPANINNGSINNGNISTQNPNGMAVGASNTLPNNRRSNNKEANKFNFSKEEDEDSAFAERDTVPPLKSFPSTSSMYGSLGRNKVGVGSNGIGRRQVPNHKIPRGRTDSTTWLRTDSVSSDVSSLSPLQSPISDV